MHAISNWETLNERHVFSEKFEPFPVFRCIWDKLEMVWSSQVPQPTFDFKVRRGPCQVLLHSNLLCRLMPRYVTEISVAEIVVNLMRKPNATQRIKFYLTSSSKVQLRCWGKHSLTEQVADTGKIVKLHPVVGTQPHSWKNCELAILEHSGLLLLHSNKMCILKFTPGHWGTKGPAYHIWFSGTLQK